MPVQNDQTLREILTSARTIAVIGYSDNPDRESYQVGQFLKQAGYVVYPVNPTVEQIEDDRSYPILTQVPGEVDIVDVFRRPDALPEIVDQAIAIKAKVVWMQEGIINLEAAHKAEIAGLQVVMDSCIKKTHRRLMADKAMSG